MRPLTDDTPKPLLKVRGKALIDWHLEKCVASGITEIVINTSYLADKITAHVGDGSRFGARIQYSHEPQALESGGGLGTAAPLLGDGYAAIISADIFCDIDFSLFRTFGADLPAQSAFFWFVQPRPDAPGREFSLSGDGRVIPPNDNPLTLANIGLIHTSLLQSWPRGVKYTLMPSYQSWVKRGIVHGRIHTGLWENITSPSDLTRLDTLAPELFLNGSNRT